MKSIVNRDFEVIMICGIFSDENAQEVEKYSKKSVEYSANIFQQKLIDGFNEINVKLKIITAPFIGSYPNHSTLKNFKGFEKKAYDYDYVCFNNIWGYRNISRTKAIKKELKHYLKTTISKNILIISYSAHEPFMEAAAYAKQIDSRVKICLVIPDLPQYMNLSNKKSKIYSFMKKIDGKKIDKYSAKADTFVILTEYMKTPLKIGNRPYVVIEGIANKNRKPILKQVNSNNLKYIVYTGKLYEQFGIKNLVNAFLKITDSNLRLVLCGKGDCEQYIVDASKKDNRILYKGQLPPSEAKKWQEKAAVLVNPRENNEEYIKYSFSSKTIEYLETGKPVVAYLLHGMPSVYSKFIYVIDDSVSAPEAIKNAILRALNDTNNVTVKYESFIKYSNDNLLPAKVANSIICLNNI